MALIPALRCPRWQLVTQTTITSFKVWFSQKLWVPKNFSCSSEVGSWQCFRKYGLRENISRANFGGGKNEETDDLSSKEYRDERSSKSAEAVVLLTQQFCELLFCLLSSKKSCLQKWRKSSPWDHLNIFVGTNVKVQELLISVTVDNLNMYRWRSSFKLLYHLDKTHDQESLPMLFLTKPHVKPQTFIVITFNKT